MYSSIVPKNGRFVRHHERLCKPNFIWYYDLIIPSVSWFSLLFGAGFGTDTGTLSSCWPRAAWSTDAAPITPPTCVVASRVRSRVSPPKAAAICLTLVRKLHMPAIVADLHKTP